MSLLDTIKPIDPQRALAFGDLTAWQECLDRGWRLPNRGSPHEIQRGLALLQELVAKGWIEGWQALLAVSPQWRLHPLAVTTAFQHLHVPFMADMLAQGLDPNRRLASTPALTPTQLLIEALGRQVNESWSESRAGVKPLVERVRDACALIETFAMDPYSAYPGDFEPGSSGIQGHSIWTRAVRYRRWDVGLRLLPARWNQILEQPRGLEALDALERFIHTPLPEEEAPSLWQVNTDSDSLPFQENLAWEQAQARPLWTAVLERWAPQWFARLDWHALNNELDWAHWPVLPAPVRAAYARAWQVPRKDGMTTYHMLALDSRTRADARAVLIQLAQDHGTPEGWTTLLLDGVTPAEALAMTWDLPEGAAQALPAVTAAWPEASA